MQRVEVTLIKEKEKQAQKCNYFLLKRYLRVAPMKSQTLGQMVPERTDNECLHTSVPSAITEDHPHLKFVFSVSIEYPDLLPIVR